MNILDVLGNGSLFDGSKFISCCEVVIPGTVSGVVARRRAAGGEINRIVQVEKLL